MLAGGFKQDSDSFLFSLSKKTKHLCNVDSEAIWNGDICLLDFGRNDLFISDNCNSNNRSMT